MPSAFLMASRARAEGPKGFSLESSLISRDRRSSVAGVELGRVAAPMSRAGLETISKKRLMLAAHHATEGFVPAIGLLQTVRRRSTSCKVSARNCPGGTSSVSGP